MPDPLVRVLLSADVPVATCLMQRGSWHVRQSWLEFATRHAACIPLAIDVDGELAATGIATVNGPVGWVGTIFVDPAQRGRGLGRRMTEALLDRLGDRGCRTILLTASGMGQPLYEKLGFRTLSIEHVLSAQGVAGGTDDDGVAPMTKADLPEVEELDRAATGEERGHLIRAFSREGWVLRDDRDALRGFVIRSGIGGAALVAPDADDARRLIAHRRGLVGPNRTVGLGVLEENLDEITQLTAEGWAEAWHGPRMILGEPLAWQPKAIWGQFNHAVG